MSLEALRREIGAVNDLLCAASVLVWDSRTMMPKGSAQTRGQQIATLMECARDKLVSVATEGALEKAERSIQGQPHDAAAVREVSAVREAIEFHKRIPGDLIRQKAELRPIAAEAWIKARAENDFQIFAPYLEKTVDLQRAYAHEIGFREHPYDALLSLYEPGETVSSLRALFDELRPGLKRILDGAMAKAKPHADFLEAAFPNDKQFSFGCDIARKFGYDMDRGRVDFTHHPFEVSFTRSDVRITVRRSDTFKPASIFGAFHETGHALYEQNVDPDYTRTALATDLKQLYAVGGTSFGAHESQSRLWENHVGRAREFWAFHYPALQNLFQPVLDGISVDAFYAALTQAEPGLIRVDADELTYDSHIMLRVEIEAALIAGEAKVADIPHMWREAMKKDLGLDIPSDANGCLQDIHWSSGMFGSFCTYTIGNIMGAQLFETIKQRHSGLDEELARGEYTTLHQWLKENIWQHGRRFSRNELLTRTTGRPLDVAPYLRHLEQRYV